MSILRLVSRQEDGPNFNGQPGVANCDYCGKPCWSDPRSDELARAMGDGTITYCCAHCALETPWERPE